MKFKLLTLIVFLFSSHLFSQIKGTVNNSKSEPLPYVSIYFENTSIGTTSNEDGVYEMPTTKKGKHTIVFQFLGYQTIKKTIEIHNFPFDLDVKLQMENIQLNEVVINSNENPANKIIRKAIENRKKHLNKIDSYTCDFYSKGIFRIKNAPKKIFGQEIGDLGGGLDSTRSGVVYLSETISKLSFKKPDTFKERIIASKVSGDDSGFSFNNASDVDFNIYRNTIEIQEEIVSPIASYAFNYYKYKLLGSFYEGNHLINKIELIPKRKTEKAFSGIIYIVEDDWAVYGFDMTITGKQMSDPVLDNLNLKQSYSFSEKDDYWSLISQQLLLKFSFLGFKIDGQFGTNYSKYNFNPEFKKKEFTNEILSFEEDSHKKDSVYWDKVRPMVLTAEEIKDYKIKDSIVVLKKSKKYLDSIDDKNNKFKIIDILSGYSYQNTHKNSSFSISSPISKLGFNTVQGWNSNIELRYTKRNKDKGTYFSANTDVNYGFSDETYRISADVSYLFNSFSRPYLRISGGKKISQFNSNEPIKPMVNSISTLYFEDNFAKYYDKIYGNILFANEILNGFRLQGSLNYEKRFPLINTTDYKTINKKDKIYTSNDPLNPNNYGIPSFEEHSVFSAMVSASIKFAQKYITKSNKKYNYFSSKYPKLTLFYSQNFGSESKYGFGEFGAQIRHDFNIENKGYFKYSIKTGSFINGNDISFIDFKHFNGNQTHVNTTGNYVNSFNLMPYYSFSTNNSYAEFHAEHRFNGYILNKIPLLNKLGFKLVAGGHYLITKTNKPYSEISVGLDNIGFGKIRFLRLDFVRSFHNGISENGLMFGLTF